MTPTEITRIRALAEKARTMLRGDEHPWDSDIFEDFRRSVSEPETVIALCDLAEKAYEETVLDKYDDMLDAMHKLDRPSIGCNSGRFYELALRYRDKIEAILAAQSSAKGVE